MEMMPRCNSLRVADRLLISSLKLGCADDEREDLVRRYKRLLEEALDSMGIEEIRSLVKEMEEALRKRQ